MARTVIGIEDVGGSFARFLKQAPKVARAEIAKAVAKTTEHLADEMFDNAPPRSDAPPHIKDDIDYESRGLSGKAGIIRGDEPSGSEGATQGEVALFNEYAPNKQPFMRPAAEKEAPLFAKRVAEALGRVEKLLGGVR
jgi:hypothetical protein